MYLGKDDIPLFEKDVVIDPTGRYWFIDEFIHNTGDEPKAKLRNGCSYTHYYVKELKGVM